jgi:hypothetical protein
MSRYLFQFDALIAVAYLFAFWWRRSRNKPAPIRNGFQIVRWSLALRFIYSVILTAMLCGSVYLLWLQFTTDERVAVLWILAIPLTVLAAWATVAARARIEYNDITLIAYPMTGKMRQFALKDFTISGPITWRGHEFSTDTGDKIYVNSYQTGAADLIDRLRNQVKQSFIE